VRAVAKECTALRTLLIANNDIITGLAVRELVTQCHALRSLTLALCPLATTDTAVSLLATRMAATLRSLDISYSGRIADSELRALSLCTSVERLVLSDCRLLSDTTLSRCLTAMRSTLRHLDVSGCKLLSDNSMRNLAALAIPLSFLDVYYCTLISAPVLGAVVAACGASLAHLHLSGTAQADSSLWDAISRHCTSLTHLYARECKRLSGADWIGVAARCTLLEEINAAHCAAMDDAAVIAIVRLCPRLRLLDVSYAEHVTDRALVELARGAHRLRSLVLAYCDRVSETAIGALSAARPQLHIGTSRRTFVPPTSQFAAAAAAYDS
jgi:hypothetical protein